MPDTLTILSYVHLANVILGYLDILRLERSHVVRCIHPSTRYSTYDELYEDARMSSTVSSYTCPTVLLFTVMFYFV